MKSLTAGKNPIQFEGTVRERGRGERRGRLNMRCQSQTPFGEKGTVAPSSSNLHYFLFLFMFLLILINGENPNSDRSWVMIFRLNWVFPTKDLSHCNHRPIFYLRQNSWKQWTMNLTHTYNEQQIMCPCKTCYQYKLFLACRF